MLRFHFNLVVGFFAEEVAKFFGEGFDQWDGVRCRAKTASRFGQHQIDMIKGDAALFIEVEGVQDAVKRFETPGVQFAFICSSLEGTFVIAA